MAAMSAVLEQASLHPGHPLRVEIALQLGGQAQLAEEAHNNDAWWANNANRHVQAAARLGAGRRVTGVDLSDRRVRFS